MANNVTADQGVSDVVVYLCEIDFPAITGPLFILIFIISVIANGLLLCVLLMYENLKNVTNMFILNLACSDLIFTTTLPFWAISHLHHWIFGDFVCKFMTAAYFVGLYSSVILLTAMTVVRFIGVVLDTWKSSCARSKRWAVGACVAAWVISISASLSDGIKARVEHYDNVTFCENVSDDKLEYYLQVSLLFFLPFAIIMFCYSAILRTVLQGLNRKNHKTVTMLLCIVAAFFICWGPYHILLLIRFLYTPNSCPAQRRLNIAFDSCEILAYSHCCMNPLLYMLSQKWQKHLLKLLHCENVCRKNRDRDTGQNTCVTQSVAFTVQSSVVSWDKEFGLHFRSLDTCNEDKNGGLDGAQ